MNNLKKIIVGILSWEAQMLLARHKPRIIAVSGSVGKTATKDAIYAALSPYLHMRKSQKSMNSEFGVPLAILGLDSGWRNPFKWLWNIGYGLYLALASTSYPKWLVLEIGADRPGDISTVAKWVRPDIVVLTHVPEIPVHVEYFDSPEAVLREKRSLVDHMKPGGTLIFNGDDLLLKGALADWKGAASTFGMESFNDYFASDVDIAYENADPYGMKFRFNHVNHAVPVTLHGSLGIPVLYSALAAFAVGDLAGVMLHDAIKALSATEPPPGRMRILRGTKGSIIIDDTYNSSPAAVFAALDTLNDVIARRKIAVLGDMMELGKYSSDMHRKAGARAAEVAEMVWTVGLRSRLTGEAALDGGLKDKNVREYELGESTRAGQELRRMLKEGDVVLVKGSQSMRMEKCVEELLEDPFKAKEFLVRQDPEWKNR